ncbi:membrane fusion protein [Roseateles sp. YR242]|uniref:HlyD family secretion protein n=1 Tax=Roseateles sp. YR242 TaxID=1855305 RepID=UPI0008CDD079|nr:HlyD family efflux transporter periplasmic adaptor subunit [Roseateles sp. YR242]SEL55216.1 membrane fusion protein [Roseateles sp. YR242]
MNGSNTSPLFRLQAIEAQSGNWLGEIRIHRSMTSNVLTMALALMIGLIGYYLCVGKIARKTHVAGYLTSNAGIVPVASMQSAVIKTLFVKEHDYVEAGQVLVEMESDLHSKVGSVAASLRETYEKRRVSLLEEKQSLERQFKIRAEFGATRLQLAIREAEAANVEIVTTKQRIALAEKTLEKFAKLEGEGYVSNLQLQQKQEELLELRLREQALAKNALIDAREIERLRSELTEASGALHSAVAQISRNLAQIDQEEVELGSRQSSILKAPVAGYVGAIYQHVGQLSQAGQTTLALFPEAKNSKQLEIHIYAPSRSIGFVEEGQVVRLKYSAFPSQKFGVSQGKVMAISQVPTGAQDLPVGRAQSITTANMTTEPLYRIVVEPQNEKIYAFHRWHDLKPGMTVEAEIIHEERAIWEWLLEPVLSVSRVDSVS